VTLSTTLRNNHKNRRGGHRQDACATRTQQYIPLKRHNFSADWENWRKCSPCKRN